MSWANTLYATYENNLGMMGKNKDANILAPIAHMTANAQLEILIDEKGNFAGAYPVEKEKAKILIPVTEASAGRSSGAAPHALCDTLSYIAGDYCQYVPEKEAEKAAEKYERYVQALEKWRDSQYNHEKIEAVYQYVRKKSMIEDLIKAGLIELDEMGKLGTKKINGNAYDKVLVRFRVQIPFSTAPEGVWEDKELFDSYTKYYLSVQQGKRDVCYLSGREQTISVNQPKGIVAANYGAKLISANDSQGYTFRGRFETAEQACTVGYEATQKIHSALTWLAAKQGVTFGTSDKRTYICWNPQGKSVPWIEDEWGAKEIEDEEDHTETGYKKRLEKTFSGYQKEIDDNDDIVIIALDAATTGRLSITYYNELKASDFFDRLQYWGETCCWDFTVFKDKVPTIEVLTPLTKNIVNFAFGTEQGNFVEANDKVIKEQAQRILHCMVDKELIPWDIVNALIVRASVPTAYSRGNWERILLTACAMIRKYYIDKKGVTIEMQLNEECRERSYLFGRLLAVMEKVERRTYAPGESRDPNAVRLWSAYANHPATTWIILQESLLPYYSKLSQGLQKYYQDKMTDIVDKIDWENIAECNKKLNEYYLFGYYHQRKELNTSKEKKMGEE